MYFAKYVNSVKWCKNWYKVELKVCIWHALCAIKPNKFCKNKHCTQSHFDSNAIMLKFRKCKFGQIEMQKCVIQLLRFSIKSFAEFGHFGRDCVCRLVWIEILWIWSRGAHRGRRLPNWISLRNLEIEMVNEINCH